MSKKLTVVFILLALALTLFACGEKKILHCDHCGTEVQVEAKSNMEEDWIIYCAECNEMLFGEDPLLGGD